MEKWRQLSLLLAQTADATGANIQTLGLTAE